MANTTVSVTNFDFGSQSVGTNTYGVEGSSRLQSVYGIASHPYSGCIGTKIHTNTDKESSVVLVENPVIPIPLDATEVCVFNPVSACHTLYKKNGDVVIKGEDISLDFKNLTIDGDIVEVNCQSLVINCPSITVNASVIINGSLIVINPSGVEKINTTI